MAQERNLNLDLIKIIAMVFVVGLHSIANYTIDGIHINRLYKLTICGTAIPLFFTVSGYLLLGRKNIDWHYSTKKIWGIIRFVFLICWIFWLFRFLFTGIPLWDKLYKDPLGAFLMGGAFWQFWYFGAMNLLYIIYPLLNKVYNEKQKAFVRFFIIVVIICAFIHFLNIITPGTFEKKIPLSLRIWNWLMYFCTGGIIKIYPKKVHWKWVLTLAFTYCIQLIIVYKINPSMLVADYNFASPLTLLYVYLLFLALNSINTDKISTGIKTISPLFLPVYTIHTGFIYACPSIKLWFAPIAPIYWMFITIISIGVSWVIMQTKIGKWIFKI
jgi:surface polysaccharide O-acyltransferase-like enzyme